MNSKFHTSFFMLSILFILTVPINAKDSLQTKEKKLFWLDFGGGGGTEGLSGGMHLAYQYDSHLFTFRWIGNGKIELFIEPHETVEDMALLYGRTILGSNISTAISAGIGYVRVVRRGKFLKGMFFISYYEEIRDHSIGLPVEVQVFWRTFPVFGLGVYAFINVNKENSFVGGMFCLRIGRLQ